MKLTRRKWIGALFQGVASSRLGTVICAASDKGSKVKISQKIIRLKMKASTTGWRYMPLKVISEHAAVDEEKKFSVYGGYIGNKKEGTGFFRIDNSHGYPQMVDPDGYPFFSIGINVVSLRTMRFDDSSFLKIDDEKWSKDVVKRLRHYGFNTTGYWSNASSQANFESHKNIPYTFYSFALDGDPKFGGSYKNGLMNIFAYSKGIKDAYYPYFHPEFESFCLHRCESILPKVKDDPWLVGYFTDNELPMIRFEDALSISDENEAHGYITAEAKKFVEEHSNLKGDPAKLDALWCSRILDWYYSITTKAIRKVDSNHLLLGSRIYAREREMSEVWNTAGRYLDVVSVNPYGKVQLTSKTAKTWSSWAKNKPLLIGEFYIKAEDSNCDNQLGAGMVTGSQHERGVFYQNYVLELIQSGVCVGWHWHQYADFIVKHNGKEYTSNKGIVNLDGLEYSEALDLMRQVNFQCHYLL